MICTRCDGTGFLNINQVPPSIADKGAEKILSWIGCATDHDVMVCDCCGNGEEWYGEPGQHYMGGDTAGKNGPYAYNGGLPECN